MSTSSEALAAPRPWSASAWPLQPVYLLLYGSLGAYFGFKNVYFRELGFTGSQIGLLSALPSMVYAATLLVWGYLGDMRISRQRLLTFAGWASPLPSW